jgi:hypothetical protein
VKPTRVEKTVFELDIADDGADEQPEDTKEDEVPSLVLILEYDFAVRIV